MTAARRKPTYGRYRFHGSARSALSRTRQNDPVEYEVVERDDALEVVACAQRAPVPLRARMRITGAKTMAVRCVLVESCEAPESRLDVLVALYASAVVMLWEWVEIIEVEMPASISQTLASSMKTRKHIRYLGSTVVSADRRLLRFRNLP